MSDRLVKHGIDQLYYFTYTAGVPNTPIRIYHAQKAAKETEESSKSIYADNRAVLTLTGAPSTTAEIDVLAIPESYALIALGKRKMANGGLVDTGDKKIHGLMWIREVVDAVTLDTTQEAVFLYDCYASQPSEEDATDEDEITEQVITIPITCKASTNVLDEEGNPVTIMSIIKTTANEDLFTDFGSEVILPTTPIV